MQDKGKGILEAGLPPKPHTMVEPTPCMMAFTMMKNKNFHHGSSSNKFVRARSVGSSFSPGSRTVDNTEQQNTQILNLEEAVEIELKHLHVLNPDVDIKKLRRTVSNRLSAQRSRQKRSTYINDLETEISNLQDIIAYLTPTVESYKNKKSMLRVENNLLEQKLDTCIVQSRLSQVEIDNNRNEVNRLQELYRRQQQEREMIYNNLMLQDESWFGRFQNLVLDGTYIGDFNEMEYLDDDQFQNSDDMNNFQPPSNPVNSNNFQPPPSDDRFPF